MKQFKPKQLDSRIYSEASDWLIEFRSGDIDVAGRKEFCDWLRASPEHIRAYLELAAVWNEGSALDPNRTFDDAALAAALSQHDNITSFPDRVTDSRSRSQENEQPIAPGSRPRTKNLRVLAFAASLLLAALGTGYWYAYVLNIYSTGIGEQRTLTLSDGSTIELNSGTKIRVAYKDRERHIDLLNGQALFHVTHNLTRPFIVHTQTTNIRAVGTRFDVYQKATGTTVTVVEGRVAVLPNAQLGSPERHESSLSARQETDRARYGKGENRGEPSGTRALREQNRRGPSTARPGQASAAGQDDPTTDPEMFLAAGEQATVDNHGTVARTAEPNITAATAWTQQQLVVKGTSLRDLAEEFNRYNRRHLVISDPQLADLKITGIFSSTDPAPLIRFLEARPDIAVTQTSAEILVSRK